MDSLWPARHGGLCHLRQASRTLVLALRGALLDLLATGDTDRVTAAVHQQLHSRIGL